MDFTELDKIFGRREEIEREMEREWPKMTDTEKLATVKEKWVPLHLLEKEAGRYKKSPLREECRRQVWRKLTIGGQLFYVLSQMGGLSCEYVWEIEKKQKQAIALSQQVGLAPMEVYKILVLADDYIRKRLAYELNSLMEKLNKDGIKEVTEGIAKDPSKKKAVTRLKNLLNVKHVGRDTKPPAPAEEKESRRRETERKVIVAMVELIQAKRRLTWANVAQKRESMNRQKDKLKSPKRAALEKSLRRELDGLELDFDGMKAKARILAKAGQKNAA